jgi:hypothetical protein
MKKVYAKNIQNIFFVLKISKNIFFAEQEEEGQGQGQGQELSLPV